MNRQLLTALAISTMAACAHAQNSVSIYGFLDVALGKNIGNPDKALIDSAGSRLGFKGSRDLPDGLKANFEIETRYDPTTGDASSPFWKGRAYVGLSGGFGAVKLGRWWSQAYLYGQYQADPFGNATIAANYGAVGCGSGCVGSFWNNNSVTYNVDAAGFSFGAQIAEAPAGATKRPVNFGVSYAADGLWVGLGHENPGNVNDVWNQATVSYSFDSAKLSAGVGQGRNTADQKVQNVVVGGSLGMGRGKLIASFEQHKVARTVVVSRAALGYQFALDKDTTLYTTVANDSKPRTSKGGYDLGVIYSF